MLRLKYLIPMVVLFNLSYSISIDNCVVAWFSGNHFNIKNICTNSIDGFDTWRQVNATINNTDLSNFDIISGKPFELGWGRYVKLTFTSNAEHKANSSYSCLHCLSHNYTTDCYRAAEVDTARCGFNPLDDIKLNSKEQIAFNNSLANQINSKVANNHLILSTHKGDLAYNVNVEPMPGYPQAGYCKWEKGGCNCQAQFIINTSDNKEFQVANTPDYSVVNTTCNSASGSCVMIVNYKSGKDYWNPATYNIPVNIINPEDNTITWATIPVKAVCQGV